MIMTQEDKELLLKDLCARLPYGVIVQYKGHNTIIKNKLLTGSDLDCNMEYYKPYLRPMSSMTKDEEKEYNSFIKGVVQFNSDFSAYPKEYKFVYEFNIKNYIDWLNAHHFDYRGLIEKDLAIEFTEENNPYKE